MKNKPRLPKKPVTTQDVTPPNPPLTTEEMIDLLEQSFKESTDSLFNFADDLLPTILFLQEMILQDAVSETLTLHLEDREINYCSAIDAIGNILSLFPGRLYKARNQADEKATEVSALMRRYREIHPKVASS